MYSVALPAIAITIAADYIGYNADNRPYLGLLPNTLAGFKTDYLRPYMVRRRNSTTDNIHKTSWTSHIQVGSGEPTGLSGSRFVLHNFGLYPLWPRLKIKSINPILYRSNHSRPQNLRLSPLWLMGVLLSENGLPTPPLSTLPTWSVVALFLATDNLFGSEASNGTHESIHVSTCRFEPHSHHQHAYFHIVGLCFCLNLVAFQQITTRLGSWRQP